MRRKKQPDEIEFNPEVKARMEKNFQDLKEELEIESIRKGIRNKKIVSVENLIGTGNRDQVIICATNVYIVDGYNSLKLR